MAVTVKDLKEWAQEEGCVGIDYYRYSDARCHHIGTNTVVSYDDEPKENYVIEDWAFVNSAEEYNAIFPGSLVSEWWEDGDKYIIAILKWDFYNGVPIEK